MFIALRLISLILIILGLMLLGADAVTSLERGGVITVRSLEQVWGLFGYVEGFKYWCEYYLPGPLAGAVFALLAIPAWAFTGVIGVIMAFLFGRKAHT